MMIPMITGIISLLALLGFIALCVLFVLYITQLTLHLPFYSTMVKMLAPHAYMLAYTLALVATLASLSLSEILKFNPCILCWYQRILMYPQVLLLYSALIRKETVLKPYLMVMNMVGGAIALYHYSLHVLPKNITPLIPCNQALTGVSCEKGYNFFYGFMTFPFMAFVVFALIFFLMSISHSSRIDNK
jgi:disulfide bond formation protein DsbB